MAIWEFTDYSDIKIERLLKIVDELREEYGITVDDELVAEANAELHRREERFTLPPGMP